MATVTGIAYDFGYESMVPDGLRIGFVPSGPAIGGSTISPSRTIWATIDGFGNWSVELRPTTEVRPDTYYTIRLEWLDPNALGPNQGYIGADFPDWKLRVPPEGGILTDLLGDLSNFFDVWVGETDNPAFRYWYQPSTTLLRK